MEHIPPEDDPLATRTLFTGNLELNITDEEIKRIFGRYGNLLDIDIKRPPPGKYFSFREIRQKVRQKIQKIQKKIVIKFVIKFVK